MSAGCPVLEVLGKDAAAQHRPGRASAARRHVERCTGAAAAGHPAPGREGGGGEALSSFFNDTNNCIFNQNGP